MNIQLDPQVVESYLQSKTTIHPGWKSQDANERRICCPFCESRVGSVDTKYHLGINILLGLFKCYRCEEKGFVTKLVSLWDRLSPGEALRVLRDHKANEISIDKLVLNHRELRPVDTFPSKIEPPEYSEWIISDHPYLNQRRIDTHMIHDYGLGVCTNGRCKNRIIIPDFNEKGELIYWTARAMGDEDPKYLHAPNSRSGSTLFNFWRAKNYEMIILTEGVFDAMRVGFDAVCTYGKSLKAGQRIMLLETKAKEIVIMYDADVSQSHIEEVAEEIAPFFNVSSVTLPYGDPDSFTKEECREMINNRKPIKKFLRNIDFLVLRFPESVIYV
jgi:hypothetical protein